MYTLGELKQFYRYHKQAYSREIQNKINYLFRILESSFGDCAHQWEIEELLFNA